MLILALAIFLPSTNLNQNRILYNTILWLSNGTFTLYLLHPLVLRIIRIFDNKLLHLSGLTKSVFYFGTCIILSYALYYGGISKVEKLLNRNDLLKNIRNTGEIKK